MIKKILFLGAVFSLFIMSVQASDVSVNQSIVIDNNEVKVTVIANSEVNGYNGVYKAIISKYFDINRDDLNEYVELIEKSDDTILLIWEVDTISNNKLDYTLKLKDIVYESIPILDNSAFISEKNEKTDIIELESIDFTDYEEIPQTGESSIYINILWLVILGCTIALFISGKEYK